MLSAEVLSGEIQVLGTDSSPPATPLQQPHCRPTPPQVSAFLKEMAGLGVCTTREKFGEFHLLTVDIDSDEAVRVMSGLKGRPKRTEETSKAPTKEELKRQQREGKVQITSLYRPTAAYKPLFVDDRDGRLYSEADCGAVLVCPAAPHPGTRS